VFEILIALFFIMTTSFAVLVSLWRRFGKIIKKNSVLIVITIINTTANNFVGLASI